jgi:DNA-binding CsgD family transcriptional regulator
VDGRSRRAREGGAAPGKKHDVASLRAAAAEASAGGAHARAAEHLEQALGLAPAGIGRGEIQLELAHARAGAGAGRYGRAADSAAEARRSFTDSGDVRKAAHATIVEARYRWHARETGVALELAREAIASLSAFGESEELAEAHAELSRQLALAHRSEEAARWGESAVSMARRVGAKPKILVDALTTAGVQIAIQGRLEGVALLEESAALALRSQLPMEAARANHNWAITLFLTGCSEKEFRSALELSLATARRLGHESHFAYVNLLLLLYDGRWDELIALAQAVPEDSSLYTRARASLEYVRTARDGPDSRVIDVIARIAERARGQAEGVGDIAFGAQVLYLAGHDVPGLDLAETLVATLADRYPMPQLDDAAMLSVDAARRIRDHRREMTWIDRCLTEGRAREPVSATARRAFGRAESALRDGGLDDAIDSYRQSIELHDDVHPLPRELVRRRLIEALLQRNGPSDRAAAETAFAEITSMWRSARAVHRLAWLTGWAPRHAPSLPMAIDETRRAVTGSPDPQVSPREREVARLIADGLSNRAIAVRLGLSERTIEAHVEHMLRKLGFRSRAKVAAWVTEDVNHPDRGHRGY